MERTSVPRRTVLRSVASFGVAGAAAAVGVAAEPDAERTGSRSAQDRTADPCGLPPVHPSVANRPDTYTATVDRVVDGAHVVILIEEGGRVVDQIVVSADEYPCLEERDGLVVRLEGHEPVWMRRLGGE